MLGIVLVWVSLLDMCQKSTDISEGAEECMILILNEETHHTGT